MMVMSRRPSSSSSSREEQERQQYKHLDLMMMMMRMGSNTNEQASSDGRRAWLLRCRAHSLAASLPVGRSRSPPCHDHAAVQHTRISRDSTRCGATIARGCSGTTASRSGREAGAYRVRYLPLHRPCRADDGARQGARYQASRCPRKLRNHRCTADFIEHHCGLSISLAETLIDRVIDCLCVRALPSCSISRSSSPRT